MTTDTNQPPDKESKKGNYVLVFVIVAALIITVVLIYPKCLLPAFALFAGHDIQKLGIFGDSFGALNTLFSGLAFAGLIWTIFLQKQELEETRQEIRGQKEQLEKQYNAMKLESFESTFFRLLGIKHDTVKSMKTIQKIDTCPENPTGEITHQGNDFFEHMRTKLVVNYFQNNMHRLVYPDLPPYERMYKKNDKYFSHYHKHLYQTIKFVHTSGYDKKMRIKYLRFLRAQLSSDELVLLLFHCLSPYGCEKFKPMMEDYNMFEHLPLDDDLKNFKGLLADYREIAFGDNQELIAERNQHLST